MNVVYAYGYANICLSSLRKCREFVLITCFLYLRVFGLMSKEIDEFSV